MVILAELSKIRRKPALWIMGPAAMLAWLVSIFANLVVTSVLASAQHGGLGADHLRRIDAALDPLNVAANFYTNGHFLGVLLALLLSAVVFGRKPSGDMSAAPTQKALAIIGASVAIGLIVCLLEAIPSVVFTSRFLPDLLPVGEMPGPASMASVLAWNGVAFAAWAALGAGVSLLIGRRGATLTVLAIGYPVSGLASVVFLLPTTNLLVKLHWIIPTTASQGMIAGTPLPGDVPRWAATVILIGYAIVVSAMGIAAVKRRESG